MTKKQRVIKEKEQEIREAEKHLEELMKQRKMLDELPELDYDELLENVDDFPLKGIMTNIHLSYTIGVPIGKGYHDYATINDLIHSSPEKLLKCRGIGSKKLKLIMEWMEKHDLKFIS